jgi:hypothetical protein
VTGALGALAGLGGVAALAAAGWGHAKQVWGRLTGVVLARAEITNGYLTHEVAEHLFREWRRPPPTVRRYSARTMAVGGSRRVPVPFRLREMAGLNWLGWRAVSVGVKDHTMSLVAIRGLFDFERLIREALEASRERHAAQAQHPCGARENNFCIHDVMGADVARLTQGPNGIAARDEALEPGSRPGWPGEEESLSFTVNGFFMYRPEEYGEERQDPLAGLFLEDNVLRALAEAEQWRSMESWYRARRIPWRRGLLVHGRGGCGKSSIARALAQMLGWPLYRFHLTTLSDQEFKEAWKSMAKPCVALWEDFGTAWDGRRFLGKSKDFAFGTLLNEASGVDSPDGVFLMITTNDISKIDPAIGVGCGAGEMSSRPGRIDTVIEVGEISRPNRLRMAAVTLRDWPDLAEAAAEQGHGSTPAQFQETLVRMALGRLAEEKAAMKGEG